MLSINSFVHTKENKTILLTIVYWIIILYYKLCLVAKHYSSAVLFVNKQKEEVMTELGAPATLSYFSSPGLRGCDVMRLARRRVLHLPRHFLMAWHLHSRIMIQQPWSWAVQAIIHENFGDKCFKCCDAAAIFFLALSSDRDGSFWWQGPSWSLFPMPLLSALSAPCSSSPHFPVGPTFQ